MQPYALDAIRKVSERTPFVTHLGIRAVRVEEGVAEAMLEVRPEMLQFDGFVHAGVVATLADHTAGTAAASCLREGQSVLTVEFKINLLRPAVGERLQCRATILKPGRTLTVVESEVVAERGQERKLVAKGTFTIAVTRPGKA